MTAYEDSAQSLDDARRDPGGQRRVPWRSTLVVVAVVVALTGGWLLINSTLSDSQHVSAGSTRLLGPKHHQRAVVVAVGSGWDLSLSMSNPTQDYVLRHNAVTMTVDYVALGSSHDASQVWSGISSLVRLNSGHLGRVHGVRTTRGDPGQQARFTEGDRTGTVTSYIAPDGDFAVRYTVLGSAKATAVDRSDADRSVAAAYFTTSRS